VKLPQAKAKRKLADDEAIAAFDKAVVENVVRQEPVRKPRHEVPTAEVVQIMADEIELLYFEMGAKIDRVNAEDKALVLWRNLSIYGKARADDKSVPHYLCEAHNA